MVPFSPPFNHTTRSPSPSQFGSLAFKSRVRTFVSPLSISSIRISADLECDSKEYVETVYRAEVPRLLGIAPDLRGAESSTSGVNLCARIVMVSGAVEAADGGI